ncbi:hypothetical protein AN4893.2 [Aspergillus nidulans FGSC A4]|uniref:Eukaryotic translation initiation factor eIF-2C4, putative (AFU_orthologue AFUA_3G11010) n=1 Tax=Emericella nidulans (strain FGSC A4 / ATCC 38163 / CBS 112.46 / NRRL 194 / M139) TaxID=227321 RepID=Q5B3I7_EMENI|nr:protein smsA [Aspergillus nidulans FGSC A4]EAA60971.1 hypothetical protein AN4893.2 [Aspergillus nidulans FGSC A4]CBF76534.1 TPA: eukaryotic translation initiation factor eIF-2C4, putative (AFU_orthologue; AFUA_3G11010) [Aspergillus nidulans FGSC A4]|eukprot:XP_662497.1 hypothetical protein AN4893.2 [Aspergillus nidulans FGSC A4]
MAQSETRNAGDPSLDRLRLLTDMCRNIDLPYGTFSIDYYGTNDASFEIYIHLPPGDHNSVDKNGNPLPGTLIERDVTSPHDWDFLLYSHIALQGNSRPVHYHVVLDEIKHRPQELQNMIYDHCYQYMRSTTSVSLFPAIYYAHLISNRARHHDDAPASSGPQSGPEVKLTNPKPKEKKADPRLLPIHGTSNRLPFGMWYI